MASWSNWYENEWVPFLERMDRFIQGFLYDAPGLPEDEDTSYMVMYNGMIEEMNQMLENLTPNVMTLNNYRLRGDIPAPLIGVVFGQLKEARMWFEEMDQTIRQQLMGEKPDRPNQTGRTVAAESALPMLDRIREEFEALNYVAESFVADVTTPGNDPSRIQERLGVAMRDARGGPLPTPGPSRRDPSPEAESNRATGKRKAKGKKRA